MTISALLRLKGINPDDMEIDEAMYMMRVIGWMAEEEIRGETYR